MDNNNNNCTQTALISLCFFLLMFHCLSLFAFRQLLSFFSFHCPLTLFFWFFVSCSFFVFLFLLFFLSSFDYSFTFLILSSSLYSNLSCSLCLSIPYFFLSFLTSATFLLPSHRPSSRLQSVCRISAQNFDLPLLPEPMHTLSMGSAVQTVTMLMPPEQ